MTSEENSILRDVASRAATDFRSGEPVYSTEHLPEGEWRTFRKKVTTRAIRIQGPFTVQTSEGPLYCLDGWLAMDARGYPYPIAAREFDLIYEPEGESND